MDFSSLKSPMALRLNIGQQFDFSKIMGDLNPCSRSAKSFAPFTRVPLLLPQMLDSKTLARICYVSRFGNVSYNEMSPQKSSCLSSGFGDISY
jgi:hypothetical protein